MRQKKLLFIFALLVCWQTAWAEWTGDGTEADPYLIYTNGQWNMLAERVNGGTSTYSGKYFKLMENISIKALVSSEDQQHDMTDHLKLVGNSETHSFQGTFDGNGHKIVLNYEDYHSPNKDIIAPFRFVKNATIKRLAVEGVTLQWSGTGGASLVGASYGNTNILSCQSKVYIQTATSGSCECGGLVAYVKGGTLNMANCVFNGTFGGQGNNAFGDASNWGGMVAYVEKNCTANFINCLFEPKVYLYTASTAGSEHFARKHNDATVNLINCYRSEKHNVHSQVFPSTQGTDATYLSDDELKNNLGYAWAITVVYSNSWDPHNVFPIMQPQTFTGLGTAGNPYQIATAEDWDKLALYVAQKDIRSTDYFQMTGDISTTTMVGLCNQLTFQGTFDGAGNTLNVTYDVTEMPDENNLSTAAPFTFVSNATIKDLHLTGSIATVGMRPASVAGLVVENSTIENCKSEVAISSSYDSDIDAGGFVARVNEDKSLTMNGCLFTGSITYSNATGYEGGGMVGYTQSSASASLTDCVFAPSAITITNYVTSSNDKKHYMFVGGKVRGSLTNCYYNDVAAATSMVAEGIRVYSIIPDEGVTMQLLGVATEYDVSGITTYGSGKGLKYDGVFYAASGDALDVDLGVDLAGYTASAYYANESELSASGYYTGSYLLTMPAESVTITADFVAAEWDGEGTELNPYLIYNKAQLDLLATRTNSGSGHTDASTGFSGKYFKLMADIAYSGGTKNNYTGIGNSTSHKFNGHFDGDNKTISGICHDNENYTTATGLFGYLGSSAEVKNIVLSNCVFYYGLPMGSIAGNNEGIITDCHVASDVSVRGIGGGYGYQVSYIIGGIVGQNSGTVSRCSFAGMVRRGNDKYINERYQYGGIAGYNEGTLSDNVVIGATIYEVPGPSTAYTGAGAIVGYYVNSSANSNLLRNYYTDITMVSAVWDSGSQSYPRTSNATGVGCGGANITGDITPNDGAVHTAGIPLLNSASNNYILSTYNGVADKSYTLAGRTLTKDGSWNTLCLPFSMNATQIAASDLAGATIKELNDETSNLDSEGTLTLNFNEATADGDGNIVKAGKPYIVKWESTGSVSNPTFPGVTVSSTTPTAVEFTIAGSSDKCQFVGQYSPFGITDENKNEIVMLGSGSNLGYSKNARELNCFRAHFYVPADPATGNQLARRFVMDFGDGSNETGILTVTTDSSEAATGTYTLDGRRINGQPTAKGLYIVNGKKVIIK